MNPHVGAYTSLYDETVTYDNTLAALRLFPGMTGATARAFLAPPARGVVLETFGAGNAPQRGDLMETLKEACDAGVVIVAISQCTKGSVSAAYQTGRALQRVGVVPGGDMTPEVCLEQPCIFVDSADTKSCSVLLQNLVTSSQSLNFLSLRSESL